MEPSIRAYATLAALTCALLTIPVAHAAPIPKNWSARLSTPHGWYQQALCIHEREGAWNAETGNGYSGGMQFTQYTWQSVGGRGRASWWSPREQLYRAYLVWDRDAGRVGDRLGSWAEWGTAWAC